MPATSLQTAAVAEPAPELPRFFYSYEETIYEVTLHEPPGGARFVPEALVHDLWRAQQFDAAGLRTTTGEAVVVLDPGRHNHDAGPDFTRARLRVGDTLWAGDVEIHTASGQWFDHEHQRDPRYDSVVLHVTLHADMWTGGLLRADGTSLPEIVLYPHLQQSLRVLIHRYYTTPRNDILCASRWPDVPDAIKTSWIDALGRERLLQKRDDLLRCHRQGTPLAQVLYEQVLSALGYIPNAEAMTSLARRMPLDTVQACTDAVDRESLLFGAADLLPSPSDLMESDRVTADYAMTLRERFASLRYRYDVTPMASVTWQFARLRPANFPPLRIAQAAALFAPARLFADDPIARLEGIVADDDAVIPLRSLLDAAPPPFWETHVRLDRACKPHTARLGRTRVDVVLVNAVAPTLLAHAALTDRPAIEDAVFAMLRKLRAPDDRVSRRYAKLGTRAQDAHGAQGLHQLYRTRCKKAHCLQCAIGRHLLE